jgi:hypothetical protein
MGWSGAPINVITTTAGSDQGAPNDSSRKHSSAETRFDCCHSPILLCLVTASPHSALEIKGHLQSVL